MPPRAGRRAPGPCSRAVRAPTPDWPTTRRSPRSPRMPLRHRTIVPSQGRTHPQSSRSRPGIGSRMIAPAAPFAEKQRRQPNSSRPSRCTRSSRARATRERIVPTGHPQASAVSAYDNPRTCVSTNACRRSRSKPASNNARSTSPLDEGWPSGPTSDANCSDSRRRRTVRRTESAHVRRAIDNNHDLADDRPSNRASAGMARR